MNTLQIPESLTFENVTSLNELRINIKTMELYKVRADGNEDMVDHYAENTQPNIEDNNNTNESPTSIFILKKERLIVALIPEEAPSREKLVYASSLPQLRDHLIRSTSASWRIVSISDIKDLNSAIGSCKTLSAADKKQAMSQNELDLLEVKEEEEKERQRRGDKPAFVYYSCNPSFSDAALSSLKSFLGDSNIDASLGKLLIFELVEQDDGNLEFEVLVQKSILISSPDTEIPISSEHTRIYLYTFYYYGKARTGVIVKYKEGSPKKDMFVHAQCIPTLLRRIEIEGKKIDMKMTIEAQDAHKILKHRDILKEVSVEGEIQRSTKRISQSGFVTSV
ncbi:hypothetical protein MP638_003526 [Amoeboaphelidium occidentale]|nr:hypothetical protein MP638_003526 [Amoeboaphelidium occidentale]